MRYLVDCMDEAQILAIDKLGDVPNCGVTSYEYDAGKDSLAPDLVNFVAQQVGGKGGGRADMAMAGGSDPSKLMSALASVQSWAQQRL